MPRTAKRTGEKKQPATKPRAGFSDPAVAAVFGTYSKPLGIKPGVRRTACLSSPGQ
jgi:hypothetical protein